MLAKGTSFTDLGTLGGPFATGTGLNASNVVVGFGEDDAQATQAFVWTKSQGMQALPNPPGMGQSWAAGINNGGVIVGFANIPPSGAVVRWVNQ